MRHNKVKESQPCALATGSSFLSLCVLFTSSFPTPLCTIHIYIYVYVPNSGVTLLPPLLFDSLVIHPLLYSLPPPEAGVLHTFVLASPAVVRKPSLLLLMGLPQKSLFLGGSNERGKEKKEVLSLGSAAPEGACSILQEGTLLTT